MKSPFEIPAGNESSRDLISELDDLRQIVQNQREEINAAIEDVRSLIRRESGTIARLTQLGTWIKFTLTHLDFQTAADNNTKTLFNLPARGIIHAALVIPTIQFAGTGITQYQFSTGYAGALDAYTSLFDVNIAIASAVPQIVPLLDMRAIAADTPVIAQALSVGGNLNASTAGALEVWFNIAKV